MDLNEYMTTSTRLGRVAQKIYDDMDTYETWDNGATPETIAHDIENDPISVIEWLLNEIEELRA